MLVCPSLKIRYRTCSTAASRRGQSRSSGMRNSVPVALMRCLARLIRWAMVVSGTMKARAISAVVRPPTQRRVRAMADAGDRAGWQHRNSTVSVSSWSAASSLSAGGAVRRSAGICRATRSSRRRRACSLRTCSVIRRLAT